MATMQMCREYLCDALFYDLRLTFRRQELFVPFINKTAPSEFFITFNYASSSSNDFDETSHTYLLQKKDDIIRSITAAEDRWIIANKQQTGIIADLKLEFVEFLIIFQDIFE